MKYKKCKKCDRLLNLQYFTLCRRNKDGREYRCKSCRAESRVQYYNNNKNKVLARNKKYYNNHRTQIQKRNKLYWDHRYKTDMQFKIACTLRRRLNHAVKIKTSAVDNLGCTLNQLMEHLESQFQPGMSWENYGDWHIDHITPLSLFNLSDKIELEKACHYSNLQPLWAMDNLCKSNKI